MQHHPSVPLHRAQRAALDKEHGKCMRHEEVKDGGAVRVARTIKLGRQ